LAFRAHTPIFASASRKQIFYFHNNFVFVVLRLQHEGEILRPPENSVPQTIVFRSKEIGYKSCGKHRKKIMFLSKYSLERNKIIASLFRTLYTPDFLIAEYYGLRNTVFWVTKDLAFSCGRTQTFEEIFSAEFANGFLFVPVSKSSKPAI
jgi:hypothetical protein